MFKIINYFKRLCKEEEAVALVEEAILVGIMGFAFYFIWASSLHALVASYGRVWTEVHKITFP